MKQRINILISEDTAERLKMYAWENHKTVSQAITDRSWTAKVKNAQVRGQTTLADRMKKQETAAAGRCPGRPASEFFCDSKKNRIVTALQNRTVTAHEINNINCADDKPSNIEKIFVLYCDISRVSHIRITINIDNKSEE